MFSSYNWVIQQIFCWLIYVYFYLHCGWPGNIWESLMAFIQDAQDIVCVCIYYCNYEHYSYSKTWIMELQETTKLIKLDIFTNVLVIAQLILIKVPRRLKSFLSFNSTFWHHFILILTNLLYSSFQGIKIKWFEQETSNR